MANTVDITIKAKDEASGVIDGVKESFGELEGSADTLDENGSKSFGDFMDNVAIAMLGINQAIEVGIKVVDAAKSVFGEVLTVAGEIEELMRVSGDAPEILSTLRLEAEKADVPFDDLYKAMENLNKNGIPPTVENLVAIADEYVNLRDPLEKAALLTENFGTAGDEIAPMLEDIAGGVDMVHNAGVVFTEEDIQAAKDYEQALAGLEVAWSDFLITAGKDALPLLTHELTDLQLWSTKKDVHDLTEELKALGVEDENILKAGSFSKRFFGSSIEEDRQYLEEASIALSGYNDLIEAHTLLMDEYGMTSEGASAVLNQLISQDGIEAVNRLIADTAETTEDLLTGYSETAEVVEVFGTNSKSSAKSMERLNAELEYNAKLLDDLEGAQIKYNVAIETFKTDIAGQLYQGLLDAGLSEEKIGESLSALDSFFGTSYTVQYKMEAELDDLLLQLINDPESFAPAAETFVGTFAPLQAEAIAAQEEIGKIQDEIDALSKQVTINFDIVLNGPGGVLPDLSGGGGSIGGNIITLNAAGGMVQAAASGVAVSLPYYWVGERGPEPFFPSVDGRIVSNTQAMSALRGGAQADARQIADAVKQGVREGMKDAGGGKVYNLTMPTSNNPADVRMAFELMEAWGA